MLKPLLKRGKRPQARGRRKSGKRQRGAPTLPPELEMVFMVHKTLRFLASGAFSNNITGQMIAGACGGICTITNSSVSCFASSAKIHKITIWPSVSLTAPSPEVIWYSPVTVVEKDESKSRTIPSGVTVDRAVVSRPPRNTLAVDWMNLVSIGTTSLFKLLNVPSASVIDLSLTFTLSNNILSQNLGVVTGVLTNVYYLALDGPGTNILRPIGVPTTA